MSPNTTVLLGERHLSLDDVAAIAHGATAELSAAAKPRLQRSYDYMRELAENGTPVYGLTTGCGPLAASGIAAADRELFQRNLVRSHAVSLGRPHPAAFVRAAMAVRTHVLAQGCSGVHPRTPALLIEMLNARLHPVVREVGSVGASGDLVELAQIALAVIGEGTVEHDGETIPAAEALRRSGLEPLVPRHREGLALINGTSFHSGAAAVLLRRARRVLDAAQLAAAMLFEALHGHVEALAAELHAARPHPGQAAVARRLRGLMRGSSLVREQEPVAGAQDAYTLRCIPQILGPSLDAVESAAGVVETEIDSISDNPLFLVEERRVIHGGNFHGQAVALALDQLKTAIVEVGVASERRIARVLDEKLSRGLPPFLVCGDAGLNSGFMGLQYCASSMAADNAVLAAPASVRSVSTNASNQDVVSMGMVAARQAAQVIDNVERMLAIEILSAAQALDLRGAGQAGSGTGAAHALVRRHVEPLADDRVLADDVEAVRKLIEEGALPTPDS
jgi:histidine ammonia-lyase